MQTAILIVAYNTCADLRACLDALLATGAENAAILVADNDSRDGTREMLATEYAGVQVFANPTNLYYARATNQLIEAVDADYLLLLNPDTRPDYRALQDLLKEFDSEQRLAAIAPQLRFPDGRVQSSCRRIPAAWTPWRELWGMGKRVRSQWKMGDFDHLSRRMVEQPMFSCIWISAAALAHVGPLDPAYPLFFNDVDWCLRARRKGWRILFEPSVYVEHALGGTTQRYRWRKLWHSHFAFARFLWRNRKGTSSALLGAFGVWLLFPVRALAALFRRSH